MTEKQLDELAKTLQELNKTVDNVYAIYETAHSTGLIDLLRQSRTPEGLSNLVKNIDLNQVSALLQSPLVRQILTDPQVYQFFTNQNEKPKNKS